VGSHGDGVHPCLWALYRSIGGCISILIWNEADVPSQEGGDPADPIEKPAGARDETQIKTAKRRGN
jgi:hypothetical protein